MCSGSVVDAPVVSPHSPNAVSRHGGRLGGLGLGDNKGLLLLHRRRQLLLLGSKRGRGLPPSRIARYPRHERLLVVINITTTNSPMTHGAAVAHSPYWNGSRHSRIRHAGVSVSRPMRGRRHRVRGPKCPRRRMRTVGFSTTVVVLQIYIDTNGPLLVYPLEEYPFRPRRSSGLRSKARGASGLEGKEKARRRIRGGWRLGGKGEVLLIQGR